MTGGEPERTRLIEKSKGLLGWQLVQDALANQACSQVTAAQCRELAPHADFDSAEQSLNETGEMVQLLESQDSFPMQNFADIGPILAQAKENRIIEPLHGLSLLKLLRLCRTVRRALEKQSESPLLRFKAEAIEPLPHLLKEFERCINDEGDIKENASPELKQATREVVKAKQTLENRIGKLFNTSLFQSALQDTYFTEREERLVVPIRAEYRSKVDGIVHDSSGSGQTHFIEPTQIVPLNNQLKISRLKVEQEKFKILQSLAGHILEHAEPLWNNCQILVDLDLIHAKALLARSMAATLCPLNRAGKLNLKRARNPELVLNRQHVVPNDISWEDVTRVIIISGPNTGGKTVTLKTIGLMSLMARAGLFLPVEQGSEIAFFVEVYADIGDDQNIQLNLSTFSAHLEKIVRIHNYAKPGALILLDELGIATDPNQGAALAEAILLEFQRKDIMTLVSTHYLSLKALAQTQEGFLNACTEFDPASLTPTYRLIFGAPGHSAALETAERLGLHPDIIRKAREIYQTHDDRAETLLKDLTEQRLAMAKDKETLDDKMQEVEQLAEEQRTLTESLRRENHEFQKSKVKKLQGAVREAKGEIRKMIREIKGSGDLRKIRKTEKQVQSKVRVPRAEDDRRLDGWEVPAENLESGDPVMVETYGSVGQLLESPKGKTRVRVQLGNVTTVVETSRLRGHVKGGPTGKAAADKFEIAVHTESAASPKTSCDLRGMSSDEALNAMETFVSQAIVNNVREVRIIHGHGMGTIKKLVRDYLDTTGICKSHRPGERYEGGDGVTVLEL